MKICLKKCDISPYSQFLVRLCFLFTFLPSTRVSTSTLEFIISFQK